MTDETERGPEDQRPAEGGGEPSAPRADGAPPPQMGGGVPQMGGAPRFDPRRRRGRRGRGGAARPPGQPFRPGGGDEDEGSSQAREIGNYERRQQAQQNRGPWRGPGFRPQGTSAPRPQFGARPGGAGGRPPYAGARPPYQGARPGGPRPFVPRGGATGGRYQEMIRKATSGPTTRPPEDAGEPIAGPHAVLEALRAGRMLKRIYVSQDRGVRTGAVNDLIREAQEKRVMVRFVDAMEVQRLSPGVEHQGVVGIADERAGVDLDELILHLDTVQGPPLVLLIDSLQDPQNFGVLLRSAEGAGVDGVVIPRHRQVGLTPAVSRTSAGASEHLMIADVANLRQAIDTLKEKGIWVIATDESGDIEWDAVDYRGPTAIVIGGEGEGIRRLVLEGCDQVVRIPMGGQVSSLNAAAAGTVVLFEAVRQRMRDAAPAVSTPRPRPTVAEAEEEGDDLEEMPGEEEGDGLQLDEDAPAGDAVRGDDQDVEEFEAAAEAEEPAPPGRPKRITKKKAS